MIGIVLKVQSKKETQMNETQKLEAIKDTVALQGVLEVEEKSFSVIGKGTNRGKLVNGVLPPGKSIIVDGKVGTEEIIPGIYEIELKSEPGVLYDFTIIVDGKCPSGKWNNHMTFTDATGDTYSLRIFSGTRKKHTVNYHSSNGPITQVTWDI